MSRKVKASQSHRNLLLMENFPDPLTPEKGSLPAEDLLREIAQLASRLESERQRYESAVKQLASAAGLKRKLGLAERQIADLTTRNSELRHDILRLHKRDSERRKVISDLESELAKLQRRPSRRSKHGNHTQKVHSIYKKLVSKYHPDRDTTKAEVMTDINELYQAMKVSR